VNRYLGNATAIFPNVSGEGSKMPKNTVVSSKKKEDQISKKVLEIGI
jgi:hypothetical protein